MRRTLEIQYAICVTVVPHAIHMPSHTYVLLGRWKDVITANNAAETAEADRGTPEDRIHALDYLVYAHLQLAQDVKAKETLELALKIENDLIARKHETGLRARPFGVAAMEARWALERLDWETAANLPSRPSRYPNAESVPHFARAVGLARSGRPEEASADLERLATLQKTLAEAKNLYWARQVSIQLKVASAFVDRARGRNAEAVVAMQEAANAEETSETHDTLSPGPIGMTAHEALGLLLLELGRPSEAFEAFEASLRGSKNRLRSYAGAAAAAPVPTGRSPQPDKIQAFLIAIFFSFFWACVVFGSMEVSTPFLKFASILSASTEDIPMGTGPPLKADLVFHGLLAQR
jgi:tetratricopeptide (TPR) repeat protein